MFLSPTSHSLCAFFRGLTVIAARPVLGLQEPLILALQLFFEHDTAHWLAPFGQALRGLHVCAVNLGIVGQLTRFGDADVERLTIGGIWPSPSLEHVTSVAGERHQSRPRSPDDMRSRVHEAKVTKALEVARRTCRRPRIGLPQVARRHNTKRSNCREHPDIVTRQPILLVIRPDALSGRPSRQVEVASERVTRVVRNRFDSISVWPLTLPRPGSGRSRSGARGSISLTSEPPAVTSGATAGHRARHRRSQADGRGAAACGRCRAGTASGPRCSRSR